MKNMKKVFAFVLALAMILTTYQPTTTYAATKAPTISAKKMTLQVGSKKTLTVKKAGKNATLKWSSNKKTVATVSKKGVVKAVKAGTANVKCKVVTKSKKHYTLTCKVTVKNAAVSKTVSTQKALAAALKDKNVKNLTIKTDKEVAFNIPSGNYGKVNLTVDAPNADVVNAGTFKSINIKAIKPNTWKEKAKGNTITVTADDARIVVEAGASLSKVTVSQEGGKIKIEAAGTIDAIQIDAAVDVSLAVDGTVGEVAVSAPAKVAVEGKTTTAIPVKVEETAKGADVTSSTPVEVKAATEISLNLSKGAEGSKVETTGENAQVAVKNDTTDVIKVTTPAGTQEVAKDTTSKVDNTGKVTDTTTNTNGDNNGGSTGGGSTSGGGSSSSGGSSSGGNITPTETEDVYPDVASRTEIRVYIENTQQNVKNFSIVNEEGVSQSISNVEKADNDPDSYKITVANELKDGTYSISAHFGNKQYKGEFSVNQEDFDEVKKDKTTVEEMLKKTYSAPKNAKTDVCAEIIQKNLDNKFGKYTAWAYAADSNISSDNTVDIIVEIRENDAWGQIRASVKFEFTQDEIEVDNAEVKYYTQSSVVVKAQDYLEYICVKRGDSLTDDLRWYGFSDKDELGNIEILDLSTDTTYDLYVRVAGAEISSAIKVNSEAISLKNKEQLICVAEADTSEKNVTVNTGSAISIPLTGLKRGSYGKNPDNTDFHGKFSIIVKNKPELGNYWNEYANMENSDANGDPVVEIPMYENMESGSYEITLTYNYICEYKDENGKWTDQKFRSSNTLNYTIHLKVE